MLIPYIRERVIVSMCACSSIIVILLPWLQDAYRMGRVHASVGENAGDMLIAGFQGKMTSVRSPAFQRATATVHSHRL